MSIFDFFKRRKKAEEPPIKKYELESLPVLIEEETKNISNNSERLKDELKSLMINFSTELKQKIPGLKSINLDNRRDEQKLKDIVLKNLREYISYLEKLIEDLEKIEPKETKVYIGDIQSVFNYFSKNSMKIYERATILIGKELAEVRSLINNFAKEFNEKLALNQENFEKVNLIKAVQDSLGEFEETKRIQKQIEDSVTELKIKITKTEEEKKLTEKNYEEYRKGNESKRFIEEQERLKQENKIVNEELLKLKQDFNLKSLSKYFHNDSKKSKIIKRYSEHFYDSLKEDSSLRIIPLFIEANQSFEEEKIKILRQKILWGKNLSEDTKIKEFNDLLSDLDRELKYEHNEIEKEEGKILKFEGKRKQILIKIGEAAKKVWSDFKV